MRRKKQELGAPSLMATHSPYSPIDVNGVQESSSDQRQSQTEVGVRGGAGDRHCFSVLPFPSWPSSSILPLPLRYAVEGMQRG